MAEAHREEIAKLEALYAAHPEGRVFTHLAEACRRAGELDRARQILEDGLRRHPDYSSAHVVYGRVLMDLDESHGAATAFRRVLDLDRHNLVALRSLGDLAEKSGDRAAAVGYYRDLIALDPTDDRLRLAVSRLEEELASGAQAAETEPAVAPDAPGPVAYSPGWIEPEPEREAEEPAPWENADGPTGAEEPATLELPEPQVGDDAGTGEVEEPGVSFPALAGADEGEPLAFESSTLDVEGLTLGWDEAETAPPEGLMTDEPATDEATASPETVPDAFAGIGWTAAETSEPPPQEAAPESGTEPVGEEALVVDDDAWASLGERAEAAWGGADGDVEEAAQAPDIEEITTWGPPLDGTADEPLAGTGAVDAEPEDALAPTVWDEAVDAAGTDEPIPAEGGEWAGPGHGAPGEVVTATMAELYAQQGFYDRAVDVYRQLLTQVPEDDRLRERLAEVELMGRAAASADDAEESDAEAASFWTGAGGVAGGEETPYAWAGSSAADEGAGSGVTAGEYFRSLLEWRPSTADAGDLRQAGEHERTAGQESAGDMQPTAEVALEAGAVAAAFEEWFGDSEEAGESGEAGAEEATEDDADLAMFRSWLQSLKK